MWVAHRKYKVKGVNYRFTKFHLSIVNTSEILVDKASPRNIQYMHLLAMAICEL